MIGRRAGAMLVVLAGCTGQDELDGAQLLVPDDVEVRWDVDYNGFGDGRAALVPVDLMVYDGTTGEPVADVDLELATDEGTELVPSDALVLADPASSAADGSAVWDAVSDRYFEDPTQTAGRATSEAARGATTVRTDGSGLARVTVFADAFPSDGSAMSPIPVVVSMGETDDVFLLLPR